MDCDVLLVHCRPEEAIPLEIGLNGLARGTVLALVSLVSVWGRNWCYSCGKVERVEIGEIVEIANLHAVFMHVAEKMVG